MHADSNEAIAQLITGLQASLDQHEHSTTTSLAALKQHLAAVAEQVRQLAEQALVPATEATEDQAPAVETLPIAAMQAAIDGASPTNVNMSGSSDWEAIIFDPSLAEYDAIAPDRQKLVQGLLAGQIADTALVGQLLSFRSACGERLPQLLRDVGEAYYAWRPETSDNDRMRERLIGWLQSRCETQGMANKIELVRPGDRFDSKRHSAKQRGIEVVGVHGWVVLRDNGKVYTKAVVDVQ